jgi:hypothetical protein
VSSCTRLLRSTYRGSQAGDAVNAIVAVRQVCYPAGDLWGCYCGGFGTSIGFNLVPVPDEVLEDACRVVTDICIGPPPPVSAETECLLYAIVADDTSCQMSALCSGEQVTRADRLVADPLIHGVRCDSTDEGWDCSCDDEFATRVGPARVSRWSPSPASQGRESSR